MSELVKHEGAKWVSKRWIPEGHDYVLHLGTMKRAVVVARYSGSWTDAVMGKGSHYGISPRSFFPFAEKQMDKKFNTAQEAVAYAERIVLKWLNSIMVDMNASGNNDEIYGGQKLLSE